jgi:hypothetical protein
MALMQQFKLHMRLGDGGYVYVYHILDGERVIGTTTVIRDCAKVPESAVYVMRDTCVEFATAREFRRAYEELQNAALGA